MTLKEALRRAKELKHDLVETSKKEEDVESDGPRLNDKITSETVRLVSEEGHCIVTLKEALRRAKELKHD
ncbi:hypothetical protein DY000_02005414 [Brassica cretica]|uniref:Uncharacterized protein n=1 Tax=Brassica cretica TaxID=69181 RepID=A0ABQ7BWB0_BRACR|nr:hypothetical protein DY000_02005414 [Brassica cretica]